MAQATSSSARKKSSSRSANGSSAQSSLGEKVAGPLSKVGGPALTGVATAAGLIGAAALGAKYAGRRKRVLGVPIPGTGNSLARQVGKAGKQFGELAGELRAAREKAQQVSRAIS